MNAIKFLSKGTYIKLPTGNQPKVYLAIESKLRAKLSFQLYNPFSVKAKLLKTLVRFFFTYLNTVAKIIFPTIRVEKSDFTDYLNKLLNTRIVSSLYIATANDKYVLQLQDQEEILGYLKFPLNDKGKQRLLNEEKAILLLYEKGIVPKFVLKDNFKGTDFLILNNLEGTIGGITQNEYKTVLNLFKKDTKFKSHKHPRVIKIQKELFKLGLKDLSDYLEKELAKSSAVFHEVFEHGDFAPWNLMKTTEGIIPFDFEYFEENGLEFLDEFKYHYQVATLLQGKSGLVLIEALSKILLIEEFKLVFIIFLMKEVVIKCKEELPYDFEISLIKILQNEEA